MTDLFVTANSLLRLFTDLLSFLKDSSFLESYSLTFAYSEKQPELSWSYDETSRLNFASILGQIKSVSESWENQQRKDRKNEDGEVTSYSPPSSQGNLAPSRNHNFALHPCLQENLAAEQKLDESVLLESLIVHGDACAETPAENEDPEDTLYEYDESEIKKDQHLRLADSLECNGVSYVEQPDDQKRVLEKEVNDFQETENAASTNCESLGGSTRPRRSLRETREIKELNQGGNGMVVNKSRSHKRKRVPLSELTCHICGKKLSTRAHLRRHVQQLHEGNRNFQCELCHRGYAAKQGLASHLLRAHHLNTETAFTCEICGKEFALRAELAKHARMHSAAKPFSCHVCRKTFSQKVTRDAHLALHTGIYPHACPHCDKRFSLQAKLNEHILTHGPPSFQCELCTKRFSRRDCLRQHLKLHSGVRPFRCQVCPKAFHTNYGLTSHMQVHSDGPRHQCAHCGAQFRQKSTLVLHVRRHTQQGLHTCDTCGKSYVKLYDLQRHSLSHSLERAYLCDTCGKNFRSPGDLQEHRRKLHSDTPPQRRSRFSPQASKKSERLFPCPSCPKQFKTRSRLSTHVRQHSEPPRYGCSTCGKRFHRSDVLKNHEFLHTGQRPHSCPHCSKTFASQANYQAHLAVHMEQPADKSCEICGKLYRRQSSLKVHLKKHELEEKKDPSSPPQQHECKVCHRKFACKSSLGGHLRTHTNDRPFACVLCNKRYKKRKHWREHVQKSHSDLTDILPLQDLDEMDASPSYMPSLENEGSQQQDSLRQEEHQDNFSYVLSQNGNAYNPQQLIACTEETFGNAEGLIMSQELVSAADTLHILQQLAEATPTMTSSNQEQAPPTAEARSFLLQCVEQTILADAPSLLADAISAAAADLSDSLAGNAGLM